MISRRKFLQMTAVMASALVLPRQWGNGISPASKQLASPRWGSGIKPESAGFVQTPLPGRSIPRFAEPLPVFGPAGPIPRVKGTSITVSAHEIQQNILPDSFYAGLPAPYNAGTYVWAYNVGNTVAHYPGVSMEAQRNVPTDITYVNNLPISGSVVQRILTFDESLHWARPTGNDMMVDDGTGQMIGNPTPYSGPPPIVAHVHGAEVSSRFDGGPDQWFTPNGIHGGGYDTYIPTLPNQAVYHYVNEQEATTLWYHDHALGATRLNVYAGMAAFYLLRDSYDTGKEDNPLGLPAGPYEIELAMQDKQFDTNGQLLFPDGNPSDAGLNGDPSQPLIHPYWLPEFFGDVMMVNGKPWPYFDVEPRRYRFRMLDGCNARFLEVYLLNKATKKDGPPIWVIGNDGGLLNKPAKLTAPAQRLLIAPGERYDVIIDFSGFAGQKLTLINSAKAPYPMGETPDPQTTGQIMQFRVTKPLQGTDSSYNPASGVPLRSGVSGSPTQMPAIIRLAKANGTVNPDVTVSKTRQLVLVEVEGPEGPVEVLVNNTKWDGLRDGTKNPVWSGAISDGQGNFLTELPQVGSTEVWEIVNMTGDAHPIHLHLTQFQLISRQRYQAEAYSTLYESLFPGGTHPGVVGTEGDTAVWAEDVDYEAGEFIPGFGPPLPYDASDVRSGGKLGGNPDVTPFLQDGIKPAKPEEFGWKDTIQMYPGQVTRIAVRFAPQDTALDAVAPGDNAYGFDPTVGPGYVWHCHIVDHEDNEMMRPYHPVA